MAERGVGWRTEDAAIWKRTNYGYCVPPYVWMWNSNPRMRCVFGFMLRMLHMLHMRSSFDANPLPAIITRAYTYLLNEATDVHAITQPCLCSATSNHCHLICEFQSGTFKFGALSKTPVCAHLFTGGTHTHTTTFALQQQHMLIRTSHMAHVYGMCVCGVLGCVQHIRSMQNDAQMCDVRTCTHTHLAQRVAIPFTGIPASHWRRCVGNAYPS